MTVACGIERLSIIYEGQWGSPAREAPESLGWSSDPSSRTLLRLARRQLLHRPFVAVRIAEEDELAPRELLDLADLGAALDELGTRSLDVGDHHLHALHRAGLGIDQTLAQRDRARRPRRRQLDEANLVADAVVVVGVEADLLGV